MLQSLWSLTSNSNTVFQGYVVAAFNSCTLILFRLFYTCSFFFIHPIESFLNKSPKLSPLEEISQPETCFLFLISPGPFQHIFFFWSSVVFPASLSLASSPLLIILLYLRKFQIEIQKIKKKYKIKIKRALLFVY